MCPLLWPHTCTHTRPPSQHRTPASPSASPIQSDGAIELEPGKADSFGLLAGGWRNQAADAAVGAAGIPIIRSFNEVRRGRRKATGQACRPAGMRSATCVSCSALVRLLHVVLYQRGLAAFVGARAGGSLPPPCSHASSCCRPPPCADAVDGRHAPVEQGWAGVVSSRRAGWFWPALCLPAQQALAGRGRPLSGPNKG